MSLDDFEHRLSLRVAPLLQAVARRRDRAETRASELARGDGYSGPESYQHDRWRTVAECYARVYDALLAAVHWADTAREAIRRAKD